MWRTVQKKAEDLAEEWAEEDQDLKQQWRSAFKKRKEAQSRLHRANERLQRVSNRYEEKHGEPVPETLPSRKWYVALLLIWLVAEVPVNGFAFQLFGESLIFAVVGALLVALVLLPSAHYLGKLVRNTSSWSWKEKVFAGALTTMPLAVVLSISWMREAYVRYMRAEGLSPGLGYLGDGTAFWVLVAINAALLVIATYLSYRKHPKWLSDLMEAREDLRQARKQYKEAGERCVETATTRQRAFETTRAELKSLQETLRSLVERYRECNLQARLDRGPDSNGEHDSKLEKSLPPRGSKLALEVPEALEDLDWSLTDGPPLEDMAPPSDHSQSSEANKYIVGKEVGSHYEALSG
jgi:Flp pilus assembly protein TadB